MTLDFSGSSFPGNAIILIADELAAIDETVSVKMRPLRPEDSNYSIGIFALNWKPVANSYEMRGIDALWNPSLIQYKVRIQVFVKDAVEESGLNANSVLSELVCSILADSQDLRTQLGGLTATVTGTTKRLKRWTIDSAGYISGEVKGINLYLSTVDLILEVEKV